MWQDAILDFAGVFISYVVAKGASLLSPFAGLVAEGIKGFVQWGFFLVDLAKEAAHSPRMLAIALANIIMGLIALVTNAGELFVKALESILWSPALSAVMLATKGMISIAAAAQIFRTPVDYIESFAVDFPIGIIALGRFLGMW